MRLAGLQRRSYYHGFEPARFAFANISPVMPASPVALMTYFTPRRLRCRKPLDPLHRAWN
jgi:hypothetical protein